MKKQLLSLLTIAAITVSASTLASAADKANAEPDVFVNDSLIMFADQNAKIVDGVTLVPARGVFECMGHTVTWDGDTQTVTVESDTGVRVVTIKIGSDKMEVDTFKNIMEVDKQEYTLEVPAQIMNDRTMIPLRAVSEAFNSEVKWDQDNYRVDITTGDPILLEDAVYTPTPEEDMLKMSLSYDGAPVAAGDTFDIYVDITNTPEGIEYLNSVVATLNFDKSKFELVSTAPLSDDGTTYTPDLFADNPDYATGSASLFVTIYPDHAKTTDGAAYKITLKSLTGEEGTIALSNNFDPLRGFESYLMYRQDDDDVIYDGQDLIVDKTPITIKAAE